MLINKFPEARSADDAPVIEDLRPDIESEVPLKLDRARLPSEISDPLSALWRINLRDRSGGTSEPSKALDILISLLLRRGVPNLAVGQEAGVTHRAVIARFGRAVERGNLPDSLMTSFLPKPSYQESRIFHDRLPGRKAFAIFQVVATTYPRFYTLRDRKHSQLYLFSHYSAQKDPYLVENELDDYELLENEEQFVNAIENAQPDSSPVYAVPAHWLYMESSPAYIWSKREFDPMVDFYPEALRPRDPIVLQCFKDPGTILMNNPPIEWKNGDHATSEED